ncbi:MAG TPA: mucoidy inhibitor MuiA family protein, partial [Daejeonella sp.]|nr:mucoidy inhibitor MuiA family protein [Daejeonella sp.]
ASGNYSIQIPSQNTILEYAYIGYEHTERPVVSAQMDVDLKVSHQALSEVVVVGMGNGRQSKTISQALAGQAQGITIRGSSSVQQSKPLEVQIEQGQTTVKFEIKQPYTIPSDGKQLAVEIAQHQLPAKYRYYAVPKLSNEAFLSATITGIDALSLLSGEATLFFEGAYLGKTLINTQNINDTLAVSLGADKGVTVKRTKQKDQNAQSFIGSNQRASRSYLIEVYNHKSQPVTITVEDQIPVSNSSDVTVESQEIAGGKMDTSTGKVTWDLLLQPGEKKEFVLTYQVKYPKNRPVALE